ASSSLRCASIRSLVPYSIRSAITSSTSWAASAWRSSAGISRIASVSGPSGLQADTGAVLGCAVRADLTVTFIAVKPGLLTGQGPDQAGQLRFAALVES